MKGKWISVYNFDFGSNLLPENYYIVSDNGIIKYYHDDLTEFSNKELFALLNNDKNVQSGSGQENVQIGYGEDVEYGFITNNTFLEFIKNIKTYNEFRNEKNKLIQFNYPISKWSYTMSTQPIDIFVRYFKDLFLIPNLYFTDKVLARNAINKIRYGKGYPFFIPEKVDSGLYKNYWINLEEIIIERFTQTMDGETRKFQFAVEALGKRVYCVNTHCFRPTNWGPTTASTKQRQECSLCDKRRKNNIVNTGFFIDFDYQFDKKEKVLLIAKAPIIYNVYNYCVNNRILKDTEDEPRGPPISVLPHADKNNPDAKEIPLHDNKGNLFYCPISRNIYPLVDSIYDVDHIDGNHFNNTLENIQILCKICHNVKGDIAGDKAAGKANKNDKDKDEKNADDALTTKINEEMKPFLSFAGQTKLSEQLYANYRAFCILHDIDEKIDVGDIDKINYFTPSESQMADFKQKKNKEKKLKETQKKEKDEEKEKKKEEEARKAVYLDPLIALAKSKSIKGYTQKYVKGLTLDELKVEHDLRFPPKKTKKPAKK